MARSIDERLKALKDRRSGIDRINVVDTASVSDLVQKSSQAELWETRQHGKKHTRYALGSMQAVGSEYTEITVETAKRVGRQLESKLSAAVSFRLQGSVPLNVHVRGVSDVDLLVLHSWYLIYNRFGSRANDYTPSDRTSLDVLMQLRKDSEDCLKTSYPAAKVDCDGGKAITLTGGSLPRPVDVVPSHWYDTLEYQSSMADHDRAVVILNKKVPETIQNWPFLHMHNINIADNATFGGLKKAIRLVKNIRNDSDGLLASGLPSFDIAALMFHADRGALASTRYFELAPLAEARRFLDWCHHNKAQAQQLMTPDRSRPVLNTKAKLDAVTSLSVDLDALAKAVAQEQNALVSELDWPSMYRTLSEAVLP